VDPSRLFPPFLRRVEAVLGELSVLGQHFVALEGYRSPERQLELYAQGRTAPGRIVTGVRFGMHSCGLAVDLCRDSDAVRAGLQPSWEPADYRDLADVAERHGLVSGGRWKLKDWPHIEIPLPPGVTLAQLRAAHQQGGLTACWELLD